MLLGFEPCQEDLRVGLVIVFVAVPILIPNGGGKGGEVYRGPLGVCIMYLGSETGDKFHPAIILQHEVQYSECELVVTHMVSLQVTE